MMKITLTNDFHNTTAVVIPQLDPKTGYMKLTKRQVLRAHRALCGMSDCTCGGIWRRSPLDPMLLDDPDGSVTICDLNSAPLRSSDFPQCAHCGNRNATFVDFDTGKQICGRCVIPGRDYVPFIPWIF